jgi:hypothetical protein
MTKSIILQFKVILNYASSSLIIFQYNLVRVFLYLETFTPVNCKLLYFILFKLYIYGINESINQVNI